MIEIHMAWLWGVFMIGSLAGYFVGLLDKGVQRRRAGLEVVDPANSGPHPTKVLVTNEYGVSMEVDVTVKSGLMFIPYISCTSIPDVYPDFGVIKLLNGGRVDGRIRSDWRWQATEYEPEKIPEQPPCTPASA